MILLLGGHNCQCLLAFSLFIAPKLIFRSNSLEMISVKWGTKQANILQSKGIILHCMRIISSIQVIAFCHSTILLNAVVTRSIPSHYSFNSLHRSVTEIKKKKLVTWWHKIKIFNCKTCNEVSGFLLKFGIVPVHFTGVCIANTKSLWQKAFSSMLDHDWLMLKHQPITTKHSAKSFLLEAPLSVNNSLWGNHLFINSSPPSAAYMHQWIGSALIQIMACCLFSAKPLPKPMLCCCQLDP